MWTVAAPTEQQGRTMTYIVLFAVIGILLLQWTGSIPLSSVGGSMTIGLTFLIGALAVGIHEAWTKKRGVLGPARSEHL
jgi:biotin transporter BioY